MGFNLDAVRAQLPGRRIDWHPILQSTMIAAGELVTEGAPSGTVVGTEEQTAGRGRHGRSWHSEPEAGLYVSVILRRRFTPLTLPLVTLALGLAARDAILRATGLTCDLRWPNDVLIGSQKCAGILAQMEGSAIIAGIGMNVNHLEFPDELGGTATSLRMATGSKHSREELLIELLPAIDSYCALLEAEGRGPILELFSQASSYVTGRRVCVDQDGSTLRGITAGLAETGFLIVRDDHGRDHRIIAGGVRPCS
jgi:BirA family biotin operon repressor/biotin-[acetyl-CoA-carboxylase] ligase